MTTQVLINMNANDIYRGDQLDSEVLPDAVFTLDTVYMLEMDMHTESVTQLKKRTKKLAESPLPVLWVAHTAHRLKVIQACCEPILDRSFFTTVSKAGEVWMDSKGRSKPVSKGVSL